MSTKFDPDEHPHVRYNPLQDEWVLCSPHRTKRPWKGQIEPNKTIELKQFDPTNSLCPTVTRRNGITNPDYKNTYVFDNDFPALFDYQTSENVIEEKDSIEGDLFKIVPARGSCKVMCFHPHSNLTLPIMLKEDIVKVVEKWIEVYKELSVKYDWVQIFENKGDSMGCSNPHPHCQIWASDFLPNSIKTEERTQLEFFKKHNKVMLVEYLKKELAVEAPKSRIVYQNSNWCVLVPYWAVWPYETMILPKRHIIRFDELTEEERSSLADTIKAITTIYDNLFECSFPYSMGFHYAPTGKYLKDQCEHWQLYAIYFPPLLRSASVKKFMVGYELLGAQPQRDLTPEKAAQNLRQLSLVHYTISTK